MRLQVEIAEDDLEDHDECLECGACHVGKHVVLVEHGVDGLKQWVHQRLVEEVDRGGQVRKAWVEDYGGEDEAKVKFASVARVLLDHTLERV